ncbi:hypothetical protein [Pseudomonas carassii]|uniref:Uncharacterized protein n=1 Tax=Pseudomonas carassii TaxID=3115855 RepID=A0ABU7HIV5_9PSED|nr:hypothetical protein [Pseudomonas sp. 137P]MEE1891122.1 hypothetical protein [Pseudomonas sp. 137P]
MMLEMERVQFGLGGRNAERGEVDETGVFRFVLEFVGIDEKACKRRRQTGLDGALARAVGPRKNT